MIEILASIAGKTTDGKPFTVGIVLWDDKVVQPGPIVNYMRGWSRNRVRDYCVKKGWEIEVVWQMERARPYPMKRHIPAKE
jgi:hypothetical protein